MSCRHDGGKKKYIFKNGIKEKGNIRTKTAAGKYNLSLIRLLKGVASEKKEKKKEQEDKRKKQILQPHLISNKNDRKKYN